MLGQPDEDGRYALSGKEYNSLRHLIVALDQMVKEEESLTERLRTIPNGLRDYRMLRVVMDHLMDKIFDTIPTKKLVALQKELDNSKIALTVKWASTPTEGVAYVKENAFVNLLNMLISMECWSCDKKNKEVEKCPIRQAYFDCLHYGLSPDQVPQDGSCALAGWTSVRDD